jgi:4-hydroxybenzoate polyprenyltransferase
VSNVPTVWTNVLAGFALAGGMPEPALVASLGVAVSLFYVGGMYLNDAFDWRWDALHRPERPIPAGHVRASTVFTAGFAMLALGAVIVATTAPGRPPFIASLVLAGLILLYDASHKANPLGPLVMALCRVSVYAIAGLSMACPPPRSLYLGAGALLAYLVFLSTLARKETLHPKLPQMIGTLVAGIALLDAAMLALTSHFLAAVAAVGAFALTRLFQRWVPGS